ncbi:MAG: hypothetical protein GY804_06120 [Alphaproteobacteria bacterium]|nr:hypothetical protein [Alphaproteobacteria bacterium]
MLKINAVRLYCIMLVAIIAFGGFSRDVCALGHYNVHVEKSNNRDVSEQQRQQQIAYQQKNKVNVNVNDDASEKGAFVVDSVVYNFTEALKFLAWFVLAYFWIGAKRQNMTWKPFYRFGAGIIAFRLLFWILNDMIVKS